MKTLFLLIVLIESLSFASHANSMKTASLSKDIFIPPNAQRINLSDNCYLKVSTFDSSDVIKLKQGEMLKFYKIIHESILNKEIYTIHFDSPIVNALVCLTDNESELEFAYRAKKAGLILN